MGKINFRWAITHALDEELARDDKVFMIGQDIGKSGGVFGLTRGLHEKYGSWRVKDSPISEEGITGLGVGAAMIGYRPIVEIMYMDFITLAIEGIANQAAKTYYVTNGNIKVPMVVRTLAGGGFRAGIHHSQSLESWFTHVPGLKVVYPSTPYDVKGLLKSSIRDDNPVVFIEHKALFSIKGEVPDEEYTVPLGKADIKREGSDLTIITYGKPVYQSLEAAEKLEKEGIDVEVVDLRTLVPLDKEAVLESVQKTNRAMVVYEAPKESGFGAEVSSMISEELIYDLDAPIKRVAGAFTPIPLGVNEDAHFPTVDRIVHEAKEMCR
ncbi:alpha-ketoacid dehydrogenase subunit beta [Desertibacillus haloalkaliphilus]|uniref:alpha-ketoacid dehydrogenase subunit beta n=1 Tax=Desertibacillus haloalkaliphilus TaxID=1328930 RepID=UPI001C25F956|nr:alpha-ketoacid dehydrogenase subunit beta [Desertibacillus haloalkaliphilus]MBU8906125.1 alpha-ketoacid dehydrogenase subunit beta [Desertibacillus haloalkaliphilus]